MEKSSKQISNLLDLSLGAADAAFALADVVAFTITHHIPCNLDVETTLRQFAKNAIEMTQATSQIMLSSLTYADRYFSRPEKERFPIDTPNIHYRVFLAVILTGYKYCADAKPVANVAWVQVCEDIFTLAEINKLEMDFLQVIQYGVLVEDEETQQRWLDTIQELTEKADTFMMVKISDKDAISSILSSTGAMSSSCSLMNDTATRSRTGSIQSSSSTSSALSSRSNRSRQSMDRGSVRSYDSKRGSSFQLNGLMEKLKVTKSTTDVKAKSKPLVMNPKPLQVKSLKQEESGTSKENSEAAEVLGSMTWRGWKQFWTRVKPRIAPTQPTPKEKPTESNGATSTS
ncbi:hypothetical protein BCR33DRAFT_716321 [Rhizoclosmatium globosum]|uniref:Cyclin N-terminal domain-containing protein n=1 Tax=Rhizoclosmatium globosum TaxID=329046 RepID=A0A1Y2CH85_9FUNG|nr:hypothetical protein BCR33DRAFT_716321 [Rhizoclosmatium globosum]|eukprot:ORY45675.1 hypothetical protein BCR33DRAFT_716321 [Rhizoclosmatium globosum]